MKPLSVKPKDAFAMIGVGRTKGWALVKRGDLEAFKIDGATLITTSSIHALVERQLEQREAA